MFPEFTPADLDEARRLNAKLDLTPRFRMQTTAGRLALNGLLWLAELYPLMVRSFGAIRPEHRTICAGDVETRLRIFRCKAPPLGVVVHFHGGGWTIGNARMSDPENASLAARLQMVVVSVDYRLALTRSLEEVIAECAAAGGWITRHAADEFGSPKVIFQGSSAGAHLAAAALLRLRATDEAFSRIRGAMLSFGLYDFAGTEMVRQAGSDRLILHGPTVRRTLRKLTPDLSDTERRSSALSPLFADLAGLPPALFLVGGNDMLLEDNERMAARWQAANGNADFLVAPESPHAFDRFDTAIARKTRAYSDAWLLRQLMG